MVSTAAVIVTMQRDETLHRCIESLLSEDVDEVLVVDNGDGPQLERVVHIRTGENLGPAGGYAVGMAEANTRGHDMLWLFNDDDEPLPGSHRALRAAFDHSDIAAVGSCVTCCGEVRSRGARWLGRAVAPSWDGSQVWVDVTTFSGLMVRTEAIRNVGVPRAELFMMFEEHEYCLRLRRAGYRIKILAEPLTHVMGLGTTAGAQWREYYRARNHLRVALEHRSPREVGWWALRQLRLLLASRRTGVRTHLRYASRGWLDGACGRMGRRLEPRAQAGVRGALSKE